MSTARDMSGSAFLGRQAGMTLIETMLVVLLSVAVLVGAAVGGWMLYGPSKSPGDAQPAPVPESSGPRTAGSQAGQK